MKKLKLLFLISFVFINEIHTKPHSDDFKLTIDYSQSLEQMKQAGEYSDIDNFFNSEKHFPLSPHLTQRITESATMFYFGRGVGGGEIVSIMKKKGYRPATLPELLAFGESYVDKEAPISVAALGSIAYLQAPTIQIRDDFRLLRSRSFVDNWPNYFYFLAIKETVIEQNNKESDFLEIGFPVIFILFFLLIMVAGIIG